MQKFEKGFFVGAATAAHQVEGNNIHSDYWAQEQLPHTSFTESSGIACDHYHRYEEDIRLLADAGHMVHDPFQLRTGKIGVNEQSRLFRHRFPQALRLQPVTDLRRPAALPHDGVVYRATRPPVPQNGRFPLVGDANGGNVCGAGADTGKRLSGNGQLRFKNFIRIVLHPAGLWENLGKFLLRHGTDIPRLVK